MDNEQAYKCFGNQTFSTATSVGAAGKLAKTKLIYIYIYVRRDEPILPAGNILWTPTD